MENLSMEAVRALMSGSPRVGEVELGTANRAPAGAVSVNPNTHT